MRAVLDLLQAPGSVPADLLAPVLRAPDRHDADLVLIAAAVYARPELLPEDAARRVCALLANPELPTLTAGLAREVLEFLLATRLAASVASTVWELLARPGLLAHAYEALCGVVEYTAWWACDLLDLPALLAAAEGEHSLVYRSRIFERAIEPAVHCAGASLDPGVLARIRTLFADQPGLPYLLYRIRAITESEAFPYQAEVRRRLSGEGRRVLVVHNIKDGQGDEIARWVQTVQALLDFNPNLHATVITRRTYLASHPRLIAVSIGDRRAVDHALRGTFDAVFDFFENKIESLNHDVEIEARVQEYVRSLRPFLFAASAKGFNHMTWESVLVDGRPIAEERGLNLARSSVYEPGSRLIAELGLPPRLGEDAPVSEPVLAGVEWPGARTAWQALTDHNSEMRPVALVNPFGGNAALKGYVEQTFDAAAAEIERLAAEGYFVVLLPNGTPWGGARHAADLAERVAPACRRYVAIAEDPAGADSAHADLVMRQFFYFASYATLVVTVEGWLVHVAWCLGKSYRVLMAPYSHDRQWSPHARTARQCLERMPALPTGRLDDSAPLVPEQPRKFALLFLLRELGRAGDTAALALLRKVVASPDREVRRAAAAALAEFAEADPAADLVPLLEDSWNAVRAVAAQALLNRPAVKIPQPVLLGHFYIGRPAGRDWRAVLKIGEAALPAIQAALEDEDDVVRREALDTIRELELRIHVDEVPERPHNSGGIREAIRLLLTPRRDLVAPPLVRPGAILILTPLKDAARLLDGYCERVRRLTYPHASISFGFLESDSQDSTYRSAARTVRRLRKEFRRAAVWKRDFGYQVPRGVHRGSEQIQMQRRAVLARSRNHLLFHSLDDEEWVLWLDADVVEYPPDILERLLATGKDLVHPNCVLEYGGRSFDRNAWFDQGRLHLDDLRPQGDLVELDAVGGTMLLVRADLHRDGLVFPPFPYGRASQRVRAGRGGELETEGLGIMAQDMGYRCWGMPNLEIRHGRW